MRAFELVEAGRSHKRPIPYKRVVPYKSDTIMPLPEIIQKLESGRSPNDIAKDYTGVGTVTMYNYLRRHNLEKFIMKWRRLITAMPQIAQQIQSNMSINELADFYKVSYSYMQKFLVSYQKEVSDLIEKL